MQKFFLTLVAVAFLATAAFAQTASEEECEATCEGTCPVAAAMEQLPKMTYKVGEESTCCSASAKALATEQDAAVLFVVAEKEYTDEVEAMSALADVTEEFVDDFTNVSTCEFSGTTSLAGEKMHCSESAGKIAEAMKSAMDEVQVSFVVGDESCACPNKAKALADESGEKMQFVIGEESTCCSIDARIKVAHAKYRAALEAFVQANAPSEETEAESVES